MSTLERVRQLQPIQFRYSELIDPEQKLRAGFSAQQVQEVFPEAVHTVDGVLVLDIGAMKALIRQARIEQQAGALELAHIKTS